MKKFFLPIYFILIPALFVFCFPNFAQSVNEYTSDGNTVLLLHLNETSGTVVYDSSPFQNDGTINGNEPSEGKFFGGRKFPTNNADLGIQLPDSPSLNVTGPLTIEAWIKVDAYEQGGTFIIGHNEYQLALGSFGSKGFLQFFRHIGNEWYTVASTEQIPLNEWVHVAGVWDGDSARVFINGQQPVSVTYPPSAYVPIGSPRLASFYGSILVPTTNTFIDEVRISNIARVQIPTSIDDYANNYVQDFKLQQNYPNPFNPITSIQYSLFERGFVSLKVYDILGNEVSTLVNEDKTMGTYEVNFNAVSLSSGIYFYTLKAGDFVQTKKMILLK